MKTRIYNISTIQSHLQCLNLIEQTELKRIDEKDDQNTIDSLGLKHRSQIVVTMKEEITLPVKSIKVNIISVMLHFEGLPPETVEKESYRINQAFQ